MSTRPHRRHGAFRSTARLAVLAFAAAVQGACQQPADAPLPGAETIRGYYAYEGRLEAELTGNVALITVWQPPEQLRRGGTLWAKVGPYVLLFSRETQQLFLDHPGLAGVRVETRDGAGERVASALLARDELSDIQWRRALNIAGLARRDGTRQVTLLEDLVRWGEEHTEFEYNPEYTRSR